MIDWHVERERLEKEKLDKPRDEQQLILTNYVSFKQLAKPETKWTTKECIVCLKASRKDKSEKIPAKKKYVVDLCNYQKDCSPMSLNGVLSAAGNVCLSNDVKDDGNKVEDDSCIVDNYVDQDGCQMSFTV